MTSISPNPMCWVLACVRASAWRKKLVLCWRGHWLPSFKDKVTFLWRRSESSETHSGLWVYWTRSSHLFAGSYTIISLMLSLSQCVTFHVIDLFGVFSSHCCQWNHQQTFVAQNSDFSSHRCCDTNRQIKPHVCFYTQGLFIKFNVFIVL